MSYNFKEHAHRYAIWTAARAVQRKFTDTTNISYAINKSSLKDFDSLKIDTVEEFNAFHKKCAKEIVEAFKEKRDKANKPIIASYGRASKIISIYLKTIIIISEKGKGKKCELIHPPIDRILLQSLAKEFKNPSLKLITWTTLNENDYWDLVEKLKKIVPNFDWRIEEFWSPERED